jgi:hypothetical protein
LLYKIKIKKYFKTYKIKALIGWANIWWKIWKGQIIIKIKKIMKTYRELEQIKYTEEQDGRRKILKSQHEEIRSKYKSGMSMREVAGNYGVDKRLIQFIVYPERLKKLQEWNKQIKHHKKYYDTEKHREYMRKYRARKKLLLDK